MGGASQHLDVCTGAEDLVETTGDDNYLDAGMFEPQPLR